MTQSIYEPLIRHIKSLKPGVWGNEISEDTSKTAVLRVADFDYPKLSHKKPTTYRYITPQDLSQRTLKRGDVLIEKSGGGEKTPVGRAIIFSVNDELSTYANFIDCIRFKDSVMPKYAVYVLAHMYSTRINTKYIKQNTGIQNLDIKSYLRELAPIYSEEQQKRIVGYLDQKTTKIDEAITNKTKLIALLNEKWLSSKEALFEKQSAERHKIKRYCISVVNKVTIQLNDTVDSNIIMLEDVESWTGKVSKISDNEAISGDLLQFSREDVLFSKLRPYLAKAIYVKQSGYCSGEFLVLRPGKKLHAEYLFHYLLSKKFIDKVNSATYGTKMPRASWDIVGNIEIPLPNYEEQKRIAKDISEGNKKLYETINKIEESIKLLEEHRSSLITSVVTGKVEV